MSEGFSMQLGDSTEDGFTVKSIGGCRIVYGRIPVDEFSMLSSGFSHKALIATDIADRIGASLVIGEPADLESLRKQSLPVSEKRQADYDRALGLGLGDVALWLRDGERGMSSNALCKQLFGVPADAGRDHPHDPGDLRRCVAFLDAANAHDRIGEMACVSLEWAALVPEWTTLVQCLANELKMGKSAQGTWDLMRQALANKGTPK